MKILGIETSCDETAISVVEVNPPSHKASEGHLGRIRVLSNIVSSQVKLHAKYGGVVPNLAAREHVKNIGHVFKLALKEAKIRDFKKEIEAIAVTRGPGLGPALLVGISFTRTLAWKYKKPLIGINHLEGHIYSNWLKPIGKLSIFNSQFSKKTFPVLNLIVSGGHTELVLMENYGKYKLIGETLDDAVGEAFDKVARLLGLGYPGGPAISRHASKWNYQLQITNYKLNSELQIPKIKFPRPMAKSKDYNFSYSGLKTSVLYKIRDLEKVDIPLSKDVVNEICYEFQKAATDVLVQKTIKAAKEYKAKSIFLSGGVSANKYLRTELSWAANALGVNYSQPEIEYTGDNAAMIAMAGYMNYKIKNPASPTTSLNPRSSRRLSRAQDFSWKSCDMDANLGFKY